MATNFKKFYEMRHGKWPWEGLELRGCYLLHSEHWQGNQLAQLMNSVAAWMDQWTLSWSRKEKLMQQRIEALKIEVRTHSRHAHDHAARIAKLEGKRLVTIKPCPGWHIRYTPDGVAQHVEEERTLQDPAAVRTERQFYSYGAPMGPYWTKDRRRG